MLLREILDTFTQFLLIMACIKIIGMNKWFICIFAAAYLGVVILILIEEDEE